MFSLSLGETSSIWFGGIDYNFIRKKHGILSSEKIDEMINWVDISEYETTWTARLNSVDFVSREGTERSELTNQVVQFDSQSTFIHVPLTVYSRIMSLIDETKAMCTPSPDQLEGEMRLVCKCGADEAYPTL